MPGRRLTPPPVKCRATSKRTGESCQRWAMPGNPNMLCWTHGGATNGRGGKQAAQDLRAANETFARLLEHSPRRAIWDIIADAVHVADTAMRDEWQRVTNAEELTAEQVLRLTEAARYAHSMAAATVTARATELKAMAQDARAKYFTEDLAELLYAVRDEMRLADADKVAFNNAVIRVIEGPVGQRINARIEARDGRAIAS